MKNLTPEKIMSIADYRNSGHTNEEIAAMLGVSRKTIAYWVTRLREDGHEIKRIGRGGRPKLNLTKKDDE